MGGRLLFGTGETHLESDARGGKVESAGAGYGEGDEGVASVWVLVVSAMELKMREAPGEIWEILRGFT